MAKIYFEHTTTGKRFDVVKLDKIEKILTLQGELGPQFEHPYNKEAIAKMGYVLKKEE